MSNNTTVCIQGYNENIFGLPTVVTLTIISCMVMVSLILNIFLIFILMVQKRWSNQDVYVFVLCISSAIMGGPILASFIPLGLFACQSLPAILLDFTTFGMQVTAGVNIWLTCCISIDRLLIVYHHAHYPSSETKPRVAFKIFAVIASHTIVLVFYNFQQYVPALATVRVDPFEAPDFLHAFVLPKPVLDEILILNKILNVTRLVTDRLIPWILCPCTYVVVFVLRNRQKNAVQPMSAIATAAQQRAEKRIRRSRRLVVGISISVFVSLLPETVFDFSSYAMGVSLREYAPIVSLVWYVPNITDPIICICSLPSARKQTRKIFEKFGCKCCKATQEITTNGATTMYPSQHK